MAKTKQRTQRKMTLLGLITWLVGILVSLSVGFGMIGRTLTIPFLDGPSAVVPVIAGWVVVIGAILSVIIAIIDALN